MTSYKVVPLFLGLILFSIVLPSIAHEGCSHDEQDYTPELLEVDEDMSSLHEGRFLASDDYPNLRIFADYSRLEDSASSSYTAYIRNELAPPVIDWFQGALKVKFPIKGKIKSTKSTLCDEKTPSSLKQGVDADYVILFDSRADSSNTVASSRACQLADSSKRPVIGRTEFNRNMLVQAKGDVLLHEKNVYLLIHEMMHTLGVSKNLYANFLDENGDPRKGHIKSKKIAGETHTIIDVPPVTERLKNFYGCSSIEGAIMENDGGSGTAGSHLDRKFFYYEVMASGNIYGRRVSEFSLAILEGSGWYIPDYDYAEPFFFGKDQGCSFVNGKCSSSSYKFDEFCSGSDRGCAPTGRGGGKCKSDDKAAGCKIVKPDVDYDCENPHAEDDARLPSLQIYGRGLGSKCFTGSLASKSSGTSRTNFCFKYNCVNDGTTTKLEVSVGDSIVVCDEKGKKSIKGYYGSIDCPDPQTFCSTVGKKYCPRNCMGRGSCVNNKCLCKAGYTGVDCALNDDL